MPERLKRMRAILRRVEAGLCARPMCYSDDGFYVGYCWCESLRRLQSDLQAEITESEQP